MKPGIHFIISLFTKTCNILGSWNGDKFSIKVCMFKTYNAYFYAVNMYEIISKVYKIFVDLLGKVV